MLATTTCRSKALVPLEKKSKVKWRGFKHRGKQEEGGGSLSHTSRDISRTREMDQPTCLARLWKFPIFGFRSFSLWTRDPHWLAVKLKYVGLSIQKLLYACREESRRSFFLSFLLSRRVFNINLWKSFVLRQKFFNILFYWQFCRRLIDMTSFSNDPQGDREKDSFMREGKGFCDD